MSATKTSSRPRLSEEDRAQKRAAERELMADAIEQLRSSEGWKRWLDVRRHFHSYSFHNQLLIAHQRVVSQCLLELDWIDIRSNAAGKGALDGALAPLCSQKEPVRLRIGPLVTDVVAPWRGPGRRILPAPRAGGPAPNGPAHTGALIREVNHA